MRIIKPYAEILKPTGYNIDDIYKFIELVGRTCYKSQDKITKDSAINFVNRLIKSGHGAMLEHGTVYLTIPNCSIAKASDYANNKYSLVYGDKNDTFYITTNYRVLVENNLLKDLIYLSEPTKFHHKRTTVKFVCDRGVSHEFVRHRVFSFAQESTRYCNYSKDKFGNELTFIIPCWCDDIPDNLQLKDTIEVDRFVWGTNNLANEAIENKIVKRKVSKFTQRFLYEMIRVEDAYIGLIAAGYKPQEARALLPNALKTELIMTGFDNYWKHFFELRSIGVTGAPHPQAKELADMVKDKFY